MYELHKLKSDFPMSFNTYTLAQPDGISPHWHENIEILHIIKGSARAVLGNEEIWAGTGDTLVVNHNAIHQVFSVCGTLEYHCLIISVEFLKQLAVDLTETEVKKCICDKEITSLFSHIFEIFKNKAPYYRPDACADALKIATILIRKYKIDKNINIVNKKSVKTEMVKKSIMYMRKNFEKLITLDDVCKHIGFTKCYFCRVFKEETGITAIKMLNIIKCEEAKRIILNSEGSVTEAAYRCGFSNMSYFTKTYKSIVGQLPSQTAK